MTHKTNGGFTLIELLVVVLIIAILAAIALPQYQFAVEKSRLSGAMATVATLQKAVDTWVLENGMPTDNRTIDFLGKDANGKGLLPIDVTNGMNCSVGDGTKCADKDFVFNAYCHISYCSIDVSRTLNEEYTIMMRKDSSVGFWYGQECDYWEDSPSYAGKICNELKEQGKVGAICYDC